ncbi:VF530 family DNA-binding protein [Deinococcus sp.]|uniref:VF530 family DNA-binding protein n=1 Tax=Deinococcus sp. TaxID=47478 RepID=UPI0025BB2B1D|nr:VF530 family DNA-binding protein [Deinococcus sp.]
MSASNPLHGVTLERIVTHLHAEYGWEELGRRIPVKCFQNEPSVGSSLKFLRKTPWAREQVEGEYLKQVRREDLNPLIDELKRGQALNFTGVSQTKVHAALGWMLRHLEQNAQNLKLYSLPTLAHIEDVNFWPDAEALPLLNLAIDRSALGHGDYEPGVVAELLRRGADVNDSRFWLPLLHTVDVEGQAYQSKTRAPRTDILDLLLSAGADPQAQDSRGHTALSIAGAYGLKAVVNKLQSPSLNPPKPSDR